MAVKWLDGGDIAFIEGLRELGEHDSTIIRGGGSGNARARAPKKLLLFFLGAIGEYCVGAALDAELAVRIAS